MQFLDFEDKDPYSWSDEVLTTNAPTLSVYWDDGEAAYRYQYSDNEKTISGDTAWALRQSKHYNIPMPKVQADPTTKKKPLGGKK